MATHSGGYIFVVVATFIIYIGTAIVSAFATIPVFQGLTGWFMNDLMNANNTDPYYVDFTPAPWAFSVIWSLIFVYQFLILVYGMTTLCRRHSIWNAYLYMQPPFMPVTVYIFFALSLIGNISWIFVNDREYKGIGQGLLIALTLFLYIAIGISLKALYDTGPALLRMGHKREIGLVRGLVHNGLAFNATWVTVATHLNLATVLTYIVGLKQKDSSSIVLGMLGFFIVVYSLVDMLAIDKYSRYMITPYIVLMFALSGSLVGNEFPLQRNFIITAVLLGLSGFGFIFKLVVVCGKRRFDPEPLDRVEK